MRAKGANLQNARLTQKWQNDMTATVKDSATLKQSAMGFVTASEFGSAVLW
jgi:hypothetical protein